MCEKADPKTETRQESKIQKRRDIRSTMESSKTGAKILEDKVKETPRQPGKR